MGRLRGSRRRPKGEVVTSPTDLANLSRCEWRAAQDLRAKRGEIAAPAQVADPQAALLGARGERHERATRDRYELLPGVDVVEIATGDMAAAAADTRRAMDAGAGVIYQAALVSRDGRRHGYADFLVRVETASDLGGWSYEPVDAKLAMTAKEHHWLQVAEYGDLLTDVQGCRPGRLHVITGDGVRQTRAATDVAAAHQEAASRLTGILGGDVPSSPEPCDLCAVCRWAPDCRRRWEDEGHLSIVGVHRPTRAKLAEVEVTRIADLAAADPGDLAEKTGMALETIDRAVARALLHQRATAADAPLVEVVDPAALEALTPPGSADRFLDFETDIGPDGQERFYLLGSCDSERAYRAVWAHTREEERKLFEGALHEIEGALDAGGRVYHYNHFERSAMVRLAERHDPSLLPKVEAVFANPNVVDLLPVVRNGIRTSLRSNGLKAIETLYAPELRSGHDTHGAAAAAFDYERFSLTGDPDALERIAAYNEADVVALVHLLAWLRSLVDPTQVNGSVIRD